MTSNTTPTNDPKTDTDKPASADSDSEAEDVFHDARFPAEEEAVSPPTPPTLLCLQAFKDRRHAYTNHDGSAF